MRVTITKPNVFSPAGLPFAVSSIQTVPDDYGRSLILALQATDTDNVLALPPPAPFDSLAARWADAVPTGLLKPDGTTAPTLQYETAIPLILASSGSFAANGALSSLTALSFAYPNAYLYFPAGAIFAGSAAGFYYTQLSSTTAGTVFNNIYTSGAPTIPASPQPFVCAGPGAYTQTTGAGFGAALTIPAPAMGLNSRLRAAIMFSNNNSAGTKTFTMSFGGSAVFSSTGTTNQSLYLTREIANRGVANAQYTPAAGHSGAPGATAAAPTQLAVDTTKDQTFAINMQIGTATDWVSIESFLVELR